MEDNKLFSEFPPISTEKWEEVINKDLKGADYDKKLVWKTIEGFNVKPYYRAEDLEGLEYLDSNPAQKPYTRGKKADNNVWDIRQDIRCHDLKQANAYALDAVKRGANSIGFCAKEVASLSDMELLLQGINPEEVKINFTCTRDTMGVLKLFVQYLKAKGYNTQKVAGSCGWDMFHHALKHGAFKKGEEGDLAAAKALIEYAKEELPLFRTITIHGSQLHDAGSNIVQELGFSMAAANELIARLTEMGCKMEHVASSIQLTFATGSNYFMEIAKIRAARLLWSKIVEQYNPQCDCAYKIFIHATSSQWNKSVFDPYVNMLRTTTETMSAAIAGADSISTIPFDNAYKPADDFGYRIARNQQLLLKEESYMDKIVDPAAGSYYIENLTNSIAQYAWDIFVTVESKGGYCQALRQGYVQDEVEKTAQKRDMDIATRRTTILGTNQYPNQQETMSQKIQQATDGHCCCCCEHGNEVRTLRQYRGAEAFEQLRLATEHSSHRPKVFLLTYGNLAMRKARSGFASNFFGVAGYEIIDNAGFKTAEEGVQAALKSQADVVVMCSSDDEYAEIAQAVCQGLKGKVKSIVLAGYPKEQVEMYKSLGVDEFIHVKTNALECLTQYNALLLK
ncbi:MAG: methylmalonyl-CoA mutase small subunit [Bacteroidales bacterium]|nr:methylmalonyl-CoA mutase small subunit [Candidatus Colimorpha onthohippi]